MTNLDMVEIAALLMRLLKKENFVWDEEATNVVLKLKDAMKVFLVLALSNFKQAFKIENDASGVGLGTVLMQQGWPIAFLSHALTGRSQQKSVYERELMAIVFAVQKWHHYLLGWHFIVRTNQRGLKFLLEQRMVATEYQHWLTKLMGFDFEIQYRPDKKNKVVDALSRLPKAGN